MNSTKLRSFMVGVTALAVVLALPGTLAAQGSCTRNGNGTCVVGGTATYGLTLTITKAARLLVSANSIALPTPTVPQYDAGVGTAASIGIIVRANTPWSLGVRAQSATWTASLGGRVDKPVGDLQYASALAGPYTDATTSVVTFVSGTATASGTFTLFARVKYNWTLDPPASYSIPIELTLTAP